MICVLCLIAQLCPTFCDPMDCSPPGSSIHGDSPGKNIGVSCHELLQGIFPTQGPNPGLLRCRWILYHLSHQGRGTYVKPSSAFLYPGPRMPKACINGSEYLELYNEKVILLSTCSETRHLINSSQIPLLYIFVCFS